VDCALCNRNSPSLILDPGTIAFRRLTASNLHGTEDVDGPTVTSHTVVELISTPPQSHLTSSLNRCTEFVSVHL